MNRMRRRDALKLGTNAAVSAAITPLLSAKSAEASSIETIPTQATLPTAAKTSDSSSDICFMRAVDMAKLIREKKLSAREVVSAHLKQIERVNSKVNAIVTLVAEESLMAQAAAADESLAKGKLLGPLHGLPVGVKGLHEPAGVRASLWCPPRRGF